MIKNIEAVATKVILYCTESSHSYGSTNNTFHFSVYIQGSNDPFIALDWRGHFELPKVGKSYNFLIEDDSFSTHIELLGFCPA